MVFCVYIKKEREGTTSCDVVIFIRLCVVYNFSEVSKINVTKKKRKKFLRRRESSSRTYNYSTTEAGDICSLNSFYSLRIMIRTHNNNKERGTSSSSTTATSCESRYKEDSKTPQ